MKYVIDHDLHIHSNISSCSKDPEQTTEAILNYACKMGFRHICLTDHFWDSKVDGASNWYKPQDYDHIAKALPLPTADGVKFDFGCETELDKFMTLGLARENMDKFSFIIIPTSHLHMKGFTIDEELTSAKGRAKYYMERNHALLDMDLPFPKIGLAHFTCSLMQNNSDGSIEDILNFISDIEYAEFFERLAKCDAGLELNVPLKSCTVESVLRPYRIAKSCGCKFYLGSDAHSTSELASARARFEALTEALNLTEDDKFAFV